MEEVLAKEIPRLMAQFPQEGTQPGSAVGQALNHVTEHVSSQAPQAIPVYRMRALLRETPSRVLMSSR